MKYKIVLLAFLILTSAPTVLAADDTVKRRPDQVEFVTESHVRLTTESLTIAEITDSTAAPQQKTSFWDYLTQSLSAFIQSLRDIFRIN